MTASGERTDDERRLLKALALSNRFHLYLCRCESPRAADAFLGLIERELPGMRKSAVKLVRLNPYQDRTTDAPLERDDLIEAVLAPILRPTEANLPHGVIHVLDASRAPPADKEVWGRVFARWNEKRNAMYKLGGEVLVLLPKLLDEMFPYAAPDVWSIRSSIYEITEPKHPPEAQVLKEPPPAPPHAAAAPPALPAAPGAPPPPPLSAKQSGYEVLTSSDEDEDASPQEPTPAAQAIPEVLWGWRFEVLAKRLIQAVPPLSLFGGDVIVWPWIESLAAGGRDAAQRALAERRFPEAERLFRGAIEESAEDTEAMILAHVGLAIALAAQDKTAEALDRLQSAPSLMLLAPPVPTTLIDRLIEASAFVSWCCGHLDDATAGDIVVERSYRPAAPIRRSRVLRLIERGDIAPLGLEIAALRYPGPALVPTKGGGAKRISQDTSVADLLAAEVALLSRELDSALSMLSNAGRGWPWYHRAFMAYPPLMAALVEVARGNPDRASLLLADDVPAPGEGEDDTPPEGRLRARAHHAYARGVLAAVKGDKGAAEERLDDALDLIDAWGKTGFDRRSRRRARLMAGLFRAMVEDDAAAAVRALEPLVSEADALLGDTAEDMMSRVIAVEVYRALAETLSLCGRPYEGARERAESLAEPLASCAVPAWREVAAALSSRP